MLRRWPIFVATFYCLGGLAAWVQFTRATEDTFGKLALLMYVLPVSMIGFGLGKVTGAAEFVLIPKGLDPVMAHALYFFPSLLFLTYLVGWRLPAIYRRMMED